MNERIRELAEQAFIITTDGKIGHVNTYMVEKFAELIIRECCIALNPMLRDMVSRGQAFDLIKQHFGVEQ